MFIPVKFMMEVSIEYFSQLITSSFIYNRHNKGFKYKIFTKIINISRGSYIDSGKPSYTFEGVWCLDSCAPFHYIWISCLKIFHNIGVLLFLLTANQMRILIIRRVTEFAFGFGSKKSMYFMFILKLLFA